MRASGYEPAGHPCKQCSASTLPAFIARIDDVCRRRMEAASVVQQRAGASHKLAAVAILTQE